VIVPADRYFVERPGASHDFTNYWEPREDPDGVVRDRSTEEERLRYLEDVADELVFVQELGDESWLLDVGCGLGWFLEAAGLFSYGVDPSGQWPGFNSLEELVLSGDSVRYDVVRCHHVIEHMTDPVKELRLMKRLLRRDGWLLLSTPDFGGPCAARFGDRYRMMHDKTHCSLFTLESCHRFLRDHGFSIERVTFPFPERLVPTLSFNEEWLGQWSPPFPGNWMTFYARKI